ncbi:MAG: hypothetical protein WBP12_00755 [Candidatus Saccharimonas sp.]
MLDVLLACTCLVVVVMVAVARYGGASCVVSMLGMYPSPKSEEAEDYDPDQYDFGLDDYEDPPYAPPSITQYKVRRRFFSTGVEQPMPNEDNPEFLEHVEKNLAQMRGDL